MWLTSDTWSHCPKATTGPEIELKRKCSQSALSTFRNLMHLDAACGKISPNFVQFPPEILIPGCAHDMRGFWLAGFVKDTA